MKIINKEEFLKNEKFYVDEIKYGKIFVYPTDTIYGIGCSAENDECVLRIRKAKKREAKPFSVIAPSKSWIGNFCDLDGGKKRFLSFLPGPYTLILNLRGKNAVAGEVNNFGDSLGVRIPNNWFSSVIEKAGVPFVTTSVNVTGKEHIKRVGDIQEYIKSYVDYVVDDGVLGGKPSKVLDLTQNGKILRE